MKILVIGNGGREHALAWKIAQSPRCTKLFCAPGNPGMATLGECVDIAADDCEALMRFAVSNAVDLTVVGPEVPLATGIVDLFQQHKLRVFGPSQAAARLEGSKVAMKEFLREHAIPTSSFRIFNRAEQAYAYADEIAGPVVVKCDGLAAGKGVTVAKNSDEAKAAIRAIMEEQVFGAEAGRQIVMEDVLKGEEISIFALCDGRNAIMLEYAQDHKQAFDGDKGPNTGGMGAFTPANHLIKPREEDAVVERILVPTMNGLVKAGSPYVGVLYMGLMLTDKGPQVIEYNVRFGDPECQPLMLRLKSDLVDLIEACIDGTLEDSQIEWDERHAVCITLASQGYPGSYRKGLPIAGIEAAEAAGAVVFHAGTARKSEQIVTAGGRVLSVCALGDSLDEARERAYAACDLIDFEGKHLRRDIGRRHGVQAHA